jgi:hypothetical protein
MSRRASRTLAYRHICPYRPKAKFRYRYPKTAAGMNIQKFRQ